MEIELGKHNILEVVKEVDFGVYLDGGDDGEILLPSRYVPKECKVGDKLDVFLYLDQEERLIATTQEPLVEVGQFACLEVAWVNKFGAFLNWGLMKDLFCPFREQKVRMQKGYKYIIYVYVDEESYRIVASAKVEHFLSKEKPEYEVGQKVDILIWQQTELGYKAIIENKFSGLLYKNEIFQSIEIGQKMQAYIKQVREDGKIDLELQQGGYQKVDSFADTLLNYIKEHGGYTEFNDKSEADDIYETFGVSKKTFKKAVGDLYKKRLILLGSKGIKLV
jgi:predicted RNA-binding protein (virulence factor B family)